MALSLFAILAGVTTAVIGALPFFLLPMGGEFPIYIAEAVGLFVAVSMVYAGLLIYPKNKFYKTLMRIYIYLGSTVVYFTSTLILVHMRVSISTLELEGHLFSVMTVLALASSVHDYLVAGGS